MIQKHVVAMPRDQRDQNRRLDTEARGKQLHRPRPQPELEIGKARGFDFLLLQQCTTQIPDQGTTPSGSRMSQCYQGRMRQDITHPTASDHLFADQLLATLV